MGRGATFFRLRHVVYCPSLGARLNPVFIPLLSQIACMVRPSIEQGIWERQLTPVPQQVALALKFPTPNHHHFYVFLQRAGAHFTIRFV